MRRVSFGCRRAAVTRSTRARELMKFDFADALGFVFEAGAEFGIDRRRVEQAVRDRLQVERRAADE